MSIERMRIRRGRVTLEFGLIVLGVLCALAVDSWAERRGERAAGRSYLIRLEDDLSYNERHFQDIERTLEDVYRRVETCLEILDGKHREAHPSAKLATLYRASNYNRPAPLDDTYQDLLSTGTLRLVTDHGLRSEIVAYYREVDRWAIRNFDLVAENRLPYRNTVRSLIPLELQAAIASECPTGLPSQCRLPFPDDQVSEVLLQLLAEGQLRETLTLWGASLRTARGSVERLIEPTSLLRERIRGSLTR
jgi:hypothetical protein